MSLLSFQVVKVGLVEDSPSATGETSATGFLWSPSGGRVVPSWPPLQSSRPEGEDFGCPRLILSLSRKTGGTLTAQVKRWAGIYGPEEYRLPLRQARALVLLVTSGSGVASSGQPCLSSDRRWGRLTCGQPYCALHITALQLGPESRCHGHPSFLPVHEQCPCCCGVRLSLSIRAQGLPDFPVVCGIMRE